MSNNSKWDDVKSKNGSISPEDQAKINQKAIDFRSLLVFQNRNASIPEEILIRAADYVVQKGIGNLGKEYGVAQIFYEALGNNFEIVAQCKQSNSFKELKKIFNAALEEAYELGYKEGSADVHADQANELDP